jgi:GTP pyrophosphokinase
MSRNFVAPRVDIEGDDQVTRAKHIAQIAHGYQLRADGTAFVNHPFEVARIVSDLNFDSNVVSAALLHDAVEDSALSLDDVAFLTTQDVADMVEGCTKMSKISDACPSQDMRVMLEHMKNDWRVVVVKVADRLHNMRTISSLPFPKQQRIASQTQRIFVPLAHFLGLWNIQNELGDLALKTLEPRMFSRLCKYVDDELNLINDTMSRVVTRLHHILDSTNIKGRITSRTKSIHSMRKKMYEYALDTPHLVYDLFAIRVILRNEENIITCFELLALVHQTFESVPGTIKDYISVPKQNGYQSLHTRIRVDGMTFELQIRTEHMHSVAEYGAAAHWSYKEPDLAPLIEELSLSISGNSEYYSTPNEHLNAHCILISCRDRAGILVRLSTIATKEIYRIDGVRSSSLNGVATFIYTVLVYDKRELSRTKQQMLSLEDVYIVRSWAIPEYSSTPP